MTNYVTLNGERTTLIVAHGDGPPVITYWGRNLPIDDPAAITSALDRPIAKAHIDVQVPIAIVPEAGSGFFGAAGIVGCRPDGSDWAPRFIESDAVQTSDESARFFCRDDIAGLALEIDVELEALSDVVSIRTSLTNTGATTYNLDRLSTTLPLPTHASEVLDLTGRWCDEFNPRRQRWESGSVVNENRRGRTSHDHVPVMFAGTTGFTETSGEVWGLHVAWSGNARMLAERLADGRRYVQAGELLFAGEVSLDPGETITAPWIHGAYSHDGLGPVSQSFHRYLRARSSHPSVDKPRPVLLNTWEAVYFDHDMETLKRLADRAAEVGAERFVLDDGWFHKRNDDTAALGDWWVDEQKYPNGLDPLVDHVTGLGLEFGLWFEPEMFNPDSELYRAHPDWVLADTRYDLVLGRNQLVLDLANPDAYAYTFEKIDALLTDLDISYVKWDMNRDHVQPTHEGRAGTRAQTLALYRMLAELGERHPNVEIESCSSGGGRADFEVLRHTKRIWTSDCNDALERQRIQRGFSMLFPPELMGAHIGPHVSHTTHRTHDLGLRGAVAFLGHLGIEWNLLDASPDERAQVKELVALHKQFRPLLHSGDVVRLDSMDEAAMTQGVVAADLSEAMFIYVRTGTARESVPDPVLFARLDSDRRYSIAILALPGRSGEFGDTRPDWMKQGSVEMSGQALMSVGVQPPVLDPESALIFHITAV